MTNESLNAENKISEVCFELNDTMLTLWEFLNYFIQMVRNINLHNMSLLNWLAETYLDVHFILTDFLNILKRKTPYDVARHGAKDLLQVTALYYRYNRITSLF